MQVIAQAADSAAPIATLCVRLGRDASADTSVDGPRGELLSAQQRQLLLLTAAGAAAAKLRFSSLGARSHATNLMRLAGARVTKQITANKARHA